MIALQMATKPKPPRRNPVFTEFKRAKLLRKRISLAEAGSGLAIVLFLLAAGGWVRSRRDRYDPGERDLDLGLLEQRSGPGDLYNRPLKRWRDPAAGLEPELDLGPLPSSLLAEGWSAGRLQRFGPDNLYEKIDGQAEQYLKFEFRRLTVVPLLQPASGTSIDVYLYDQGSFANALGLYEEQRGDKAAESLGPVQFTPTRLGAFGIAGRHFFQVIGTPEGGALRAKTRELVAAFATLAESGETPAPFRVLAEGIGLPLEAIGYTPVNAFSLSFAERFWFGRPSPDSSARVYVHRADSAEAARALAERLLAEQETELEPLPGGDGLRLARHRYLGTHYTFGSEGPMVFGVEDEADRRTAEELDARLRAALRAASDPEARPVARAAPATERSGARDAGHGQGEGEGS